MWNTPKKEKLDTIPRLFETEQTSLKEKTIHLHFFIGSCDWFVCEFDGQDKFFGFVCLNGDLEMAEWAVDLGFYLSISGPVTYKNARRLPEIVAAVPLGRLLVETDCPYLAPHPYRGKRNEPAYVRLVAERVAALQGISLEELANATTANAQHLFQFEVGGSGSEKD